MNDRSNMHLVIDDLSCQVRDTRISQAVRVFERSCNGAVKVYSVSLLCAELEASMEGLLENCDPQKTVMVFPGEGAETVKAVLSNKLRNQFRTISVAAKRMKDAKSSEIIGIDLPWPREKFDEVTETEKISTVIVFDDVIDSGATLQAVNKKLIYSNASWYAGALIIFCPLPYAEHEPYVYSVEGYEKVFASVILQRGGNQVPLNSLSSFVEGGEKCEKLVEHMLRQFVGPQDRDQFVGSLLALRELLGYSASSGSLDSSWYLSAVSV